MKMIAVSTLHVALVVLFALTGFLYFGIFVDGNPASPGHVHYLEGGYHMIAGIVVLPLLMVVGVGFLFLVPHPQKWLPWIGLAALSWEGPYFMHSVYYAFPETLRPSSLAGVGMALAFVFCCTAAWQGFYLWHQSSKVIDSAS